MDISSSINAGPSERRASRTEPIKPLQNIAPCILTPLTQDITKPLDNPPSSRVERLERIIATIDEQTGAVKDNLLWMLDRERQRITQQAQAAEEARGIEDVPPNLPYGETAFIINNMRAQADPKTDYNLVLPPVDTSRGPRPQASIRETALHSICVLAEKSVEQLNGYDAFMKDIKGEYLDRLDIEAKRFQRPEGTRTRGR